MNEQDKDEVTAGALRAGDVIHLRAEGSWEEWQLTGCGPPVGSLSPGFFACP